jgi:hypothetical protein
MHTSVATWPSCQTVECLPWVGTWSRDEEREELEQKSSSFLLPEELQDMSTLLLGTMGMLRMQIGSSVA